MSPQSPPLAPKLYIRVRDVLMHEIETGMLRAGTRLSESGVAARFRISRAPARQALGELEQLGLLARSSGRGFDVIGTTHPLQASAGVSGGADIRTAYSWQVIYPQIELEVVSRTTLAAWRLNEAVLARHYGVSRTVAREVVARLQERGIISKDASGRWYAPALTRKHIDELYELRWLLEPVALEKAASNLPEGLLAKMRGNLEAAMQAKVLSSDRLDLLEQELHVELLDHCRNGALLRAIRLPQALLVAHHFLYRQTSDLFASEPFLPEHLLVLDALQSGSIETAQAHLVNHLQVSRQRAMQRIEAVAATIDLQPLPYLERL
ncbi:GntR family transcriptional regulator [Rhizobium helianthi]|uniref:GntR family transcriptional regulator n=1 Tax=Rhizobium helianthi TaxID=1132695 RepID=A0ABW4M171_9HYPH